MTTQSKKIDTNAFEDDAEELSAIKLERIKTNLKQMKTEITKRIIGQDKFVDLVIITFLAQEGILVEGSPGISKTTVLKMWGKLTGCSFFKIQFQPDTKVYELIGSIDMKVWRETGKVKYLLDKGAKAEIILFDEPNKGPSDLMAVTRQMLQEREYQDQKLPLIFFCAALNPTDERDLEPADMDRFAVSLRIEGNIERNEENNILKILSLDEFTDPVDAIKPLKDIDIKKILKIVPQVKISGYIYDLLRTILITIQQESRVGISDRIIGKTKKLLKASALYDGRKEVDLSDVEKLMFNILTHRSDISKRELDNYIQTAIDIWKMKIAKSKGETVSQELSERVRARVSNIDNKRYLHRKYSEMKFDNIKKKDRDN
jgi:MoxR-like ATPase